MGDDGDCVPSRGKVTIAIGSNSSTRLISDVLYVLELDQNLFTVGQIFVNYNKLTFEDMKCVIFDPKGKRFVKLK